MKNKSIIRAVIISITVIAIVTISLLIYRETSTLYIASVNPDRNKIPTVSSFIEVSFNKDIESVGFANIVSENNVLNNYSIDGKTIKFNLISGAAEEGSAQIYLENIISSDEYKIDSKYININFTNYRDDKIPQDVLDSLIEEQDVMTDKNADPILNIIPYSTIDYDITPNLTRTNSDGSSIVDIDITVQLSNADTGEYYEQAVKQKQQSALDYLESKDVVLKNYTINFFTKQL